MSKVDFLQFLKKQENPIPKYFDNLQLKWNKMLKYDTVFKLYSHILYLCKMHFRKNRPFDTLILVMKKLYGKGWEWSIGQIKTCRKKRHVGIDDIKEMPDLICDKTAVGRNYNSTRDNLTAHQIEIHSLPHHFETPLPTNSLSDSMRCPSLLHQSPIRSLYKPESRSHVS